ncbi:MAG TPA: hypothetical protein VHV83_06450 [Armatimonadota bacterium]|nr:hypothetical protein [Armatimonadota bacterium]
MSNSNNNYYHQLPGRLRIAVENLRDHAELAKTLEIQLSQQPGIRSARANAITGTVLINYHRDETSPEKIFELLTQYGHQPLTNTNAYVPNSSHAHVEQQHVTCRTCGTEMVVTITHTQTADSDVELFRNLGSSLGKKLVKATLGQALTGPLAGIMLDLM